MTNWESKQKTI